jgi:hypothetical protein
MDKIKYKEFVDEQFELARQRIRKKLVPIDSLSDGEVKDLIGIYRIAIEPNFIPWMQRAYETAKSDIAKRVILKNIQDEISQDHPKLLRDFSASSGVLLHTRHYATVSKPVLEMWTLFGNNDSLTNVTIATTLENTSLEFIPYLRNLGKKAGCTDFTYTDVHGEADLKHARELNRGLIEEMGYAADPLKTVAVAVDKTTSFLESIFHIEN